MAMSVEVEEDHMMCPSTLIVGNFSAEGTHEQPPRGVSAEEWRLVNATMGSWFKYYSFNDLWLASGGSFLATATMVSWLTSNPDLIPIPLFL